MAKILQITVKREQLPGLTQYTYPPEYDAKKIQVLCYEDRDETLLRNNGDQFCIGVVSDADAPQFWVSSDITEIGRTDAIVKGRRWRPQINKITNDDEVIRVIIKKMKGIVLTQKEKDALDPDSSEKGINKSRLFDDLLDGTTSII